MDLSFTSEQDAVRGLAREIITNACTDERLRALDAGAERFDAALWQELARAGLLGFAVSELEGGSGGGMIEWSLVLEEAGRAAAPVPVWNTAAAVTAIARHASGARRADLVRGVADGTVIVAAALEPGGALHADDGSGGVSLTGTLGFVPLADRAAAIVVPVGDGLGEGLAIVDPRADGVRVERQHVPGREPLFAVTVARAAAERIGDREALRDARERALVAVCAAIVGLCDGALRMTATYTSTREQFDRPLATFQAVQQRAADAYVDVEVTRWATWHAAWRLDEGLPASEEVAIAKYWAAEGAARVLAAAQHLHGGMGVDMEYPLHRYTFLARQLELALGGARAQLERIGELIAP